MLDVPFHSTENKCSPDGSHSVQEVLLSAPFLVAVLTVEVLAVPVLSAVPESVEGGYSLD